MAENIPMGPPKKRKPLTTKKKSPPKKPVPSRGAQVGTKRAKKIAKAGPTQDARDFPRRPKAKTPSKLAELQKADAAAQLKLRLKASRKKTAAAQAKFAAQMAAPLKNKNKK